VRGRAQQEKTCLARSDPGQLGHLVLLILAAAAATAGCRSRVADRAPAAKMVDEAGRQVGLRRAPAARVVSLAPNITEILFALGAGATVVGVDRYSDQPAAEVTRVAQVGSNYEPSLERIVGLTPDVVFTSLSANRRETVDALERLGVPVFVTDTRGIADLDRTIRNVGLAVGRQPAAEAEIARLHRTFEAVTRTVAGRPRPRTLVVVWDDPLYVAGRGTFLHDLVELAGGHNIAADAAGFAKYPLERVLRAEPEVLILPTHDLAVAGPRNVGYWSRWPALPAVRTRRVHAVEDSLISRPGPRLGDGAAQLRDLLHPP
jgi:iron complex transport system substrate-binding protein